MKTRMTILDMDGTLLNTPLPDVGKPLYEKITGTPYPHKGWWGRVESLHPEFDIQPKQEILAEYNKAKERGDILVLLTNRQGYLKERIEELLTGLGLTFDVYSYKYNNKNKQQRVVDILKHCPNVNEIEFFDDMEEHLIDFERFKIDAPSLKVITHLVA